MFVHMLEQLLTFIKLILTVKADVLLQSVQFGVVGNLPYPTGAEATPFYGTAVLSNKLFPPFGSFVLARFLCWN